MRNKRRTQWAANLAPVLVVGLLLTACSPNTPRAEEIISVLDNAGEPAEAPDPRLAGRWQTVLATSVEPRPLELVITLEDEVAQIVMVAPNQGYAEVEFAQVRVDGSRIGFATPLGALRFEGALRDESEIAGQVFQGGYTSDLSWSRVEP